MGFHDGPLPPQGLRAGEAPNPTGGRADAYRSSSRATPRASKAAVSSRPAFTAAGQPA